MYWVFEKLCQEKHVTPYQVSSVTGVSQTTLSRWKTKGTDPDLKNLVRIAGFFDTTVDYLITGDTRSRYYLDDKTLMKVGKLYKEHTALFEALPESSEEDIQFVTDYLNRVKKTNPNG